jgi:hypothetical protein
VRQSLNSGIFFSNRSMRTRSFRDLVSR